MGGTGLKHFKHYKAFIEYSNDMDDFHKILKNTTQIKKRKILIIFDDMIADMLSNKKLYPMVTEIFVRGRKLIISRFYYTTLFYCSRKYQTKFYGLFYYKNSKQMGT